MPGSAALRSADTLAAASLTISEQTSDAIPANETRGSKTWHFERDIDHGEIRALAGLAIKGRNFLRFYVRGFVVFDDVFGVRHTSYFLIKVRQNNWYAQKGGETFNRVDRKKIESDAANDEAES